MQGSISASQVRGKTKTTSITTPRLRNSFTQSSQLQKREAMGCITSKQTSESGRRQATAPPPSLTSIRREPISNEPVRNDDGINLYSRPTKPHSMRSELTSLLRLPNELLLEVAKHLRTTRDLSAFTQVNKRLAILLDHLLSDTLLRHYRAPATQRPLFADVRRDPDSLVVRLLRLDVDLNARFCHCVGSPSWCRCMPALHAAITYSNITMVDSLLRHGARIDAPYGCRGDNAVHLAIETAELCSGHFQILREVNMTILRMLLGEGRLHTMNDPGSLNSAGRTWLNTAVRTCPRRHVTLVEPFLSDGLSVNVAEWESNYTPLHIAVLNNREELVALLLNQGADHRTIDSRDRTPFGYACNRPNCAIMDLLLRHDVTLIDMVVNDSGETVELSLERHLERLRLTEDRESQYYVERMWRMQKLLDKLMKVSQARKDSVIPDAVLQIYYNSL